MVDILHVVGVRTPSPDRVYEALTSIDGLRGWWTTHTQGDETVGGTVRFRFETGGFDMKIADLRAGKSVLWQVTDGPGEWIGTTIRFELRPEGEYVRVFFKHQGWKEPSEFMHHCSTKWASFLLSMKALVETGKGAPHPNDVRIISDKH